MPDLIWSGKIFVKIPVSFDFYNLVNIQKLKAYNFNLIVHIVWLVKEPKLWPEQIIRISFLQSQHDLHPNTRHTTNKLLSSIDS